MSKKFRLRGCFDRQHGKRAQALLKSAYTAFIIFIGHWRGNWVGKSLSYWHVKSWECLLTYWLPMESILFIIETFEQYQFRCNYLRNKKLLLNFLLHFWNLTKILNVLKKKITLIAFVFPKLRTPKMWFKKCRNSPISENASTSNMVKGPKYCSNLDHITFIIFIDHCQVNWVWKILFYCDAKSWDCLLTHWQRMKSILFFISTI